MIILPLHIRSILVGLILSDGWVIFDNKKAKNALFGFAQSADNFVYFFFVFNLLSHYCSNYPTYRTRKIEGKLKYGLQFKTRSMPCITELRSLFYPEQSTKKIIPLNIYDLLTPAALAHLIMGDGTAKDHGLILCTDPYTIQDIVRLINVLIVRYRLECNLRYHTPTQPRIYIRERSMPILRTIPHFTKNLRLYSSLATCESQINLNPY